MTKAERDDEYYIRIYNSYDCSIRAELAATSQEERDQWYSVLSTGKHTNHN